MNVVARKNGVPKRLDVSQLRASDPGRSVDPLEDVIFQNRHRHSSSLQYFVVEFPNVEIVACISTRRQEETARTNERRPSSRRGYARSHSKYVSSPARTSSADKWRQLFRAFRRKPRTPSPDDLRPLSSGSERWRTVRFLKAGCPLVTLLRYWSAASVVVRAGGMQE